MLDARDLSLYGEQVEVVLHQSLRREQRFESVDALKAQIARDCEAARAVLRVLPQA